jgi:hypothetical protein
MNDKKNKDIDYKAITLFILTFCQLNCEILFSQNKDTILNNFKKSQQLKLDSITNLYTEKSKLKYLSMLPSISYDIDAKTLNLGISLHNFSNYLQAKQRIKIELARFKMQYEEIQQNQINLLQNEYETIINNYQTILLEVKYKKTFDELFNLKKVQYEKNTITLEDWLTVQNERNSYLLSLTSKIEASILKMARFQTKIKSPCFTQELQYFNSLNFK